MTLILVWKALAHVRVLCVGRLPHNAECGWASTNSRATPSHARRSHAQVLWVDRLTPEEFQRGFGSHTPMFSGQTKCVRYFMNCARGLRLFRSIVLDVGYVVDGQDRQIALTDKMRKKLEKVRSCVP